MPEPDVKIHQFDKAGKIVDTLVDAAGAAVDLTGASVFFTMTPISGGSAIVSGATAVNDQAGAGTTGNVHYPLATGDADTDGFYLGSWRVTHGSTAVATYPVTGYRLIEISPDAPMNLGTAYVSLEELKADTELTNFDFDDIKLNRARLAASRAIDAACGTLRRFWHDPDATSHRLYTPTSERILVIDDLAVLTSVTIDRTGSGAFGETWTLGTEFVLEPANAATDGRPYEEIRVRSLSARRFPCWVEHSVKVTGQFGWAAVPDEIVEATKILTRKLLRRSETPFGIVTAGIDNAAAMRIARTDPDVANLIADLARRRPFA